MQFGRSASATSIAWFKRLMAVAQGHGIECLLRGQRGRLEQDSSAIPGPARENGLKEKQNRHQRHATTSRSLILESWPETAAPRTQRRKQEARDASGSTG